MNDSGEADPVGALQASAAVMTTPCGQGSMVWRCWGEGEPLVLLLGGSGSWRHWLRNIGFFARSREVWCPDLPGLGDSDMPDPPVDVQAVASVMRAGLERLFGRRPVVDVAAFSFGGIAGAVALAGARLPLRHFVLVGSTALGLPAPRFALQPWKGEADPQRREAILRRNLLSLMLARIAPGDELALRLYADDLERARFNSRHSARTTLLRDHLAQIPGRIAGIWGALDAAVDAEPARAEAAMRAVVPGLRFQVIADGGHWIQYEQPQRFNEALAAMLAD